MEQEELGHNKMSTSYLSSAVKQFGYYRMLGEKAMAQVADEVLFWQYNAESNSIAVIVSHLAGNMLSRFTDFLNSDGEKPWRNRDAEFEVSVSNREELMKQWNAGWECLQQALESLTEADLERTVYICATMGTQWPRPSIDSWPIIPII